VFEVIAGFSANGTRKCEKCGAIAKRLISAPQVVFHGNGFYVTDNKRPSKPAPSGDIKPESKPETTDSAATKKDTNKTD
jgi:predicted nucleic acid-binding Zn ribbon protein